MSEKYVSLYKLRKKRDQLERKLDRLVDPDKVFKTYQEMAELDAEIDRRLSRHR